MSSYLYAEYLFTPTHGPVPPAAIVPHCQGNHRPFRRGTGSTPSATRFMPRPHTIPIVHFLNMSLQLVHLRGKHPDT